MKTIMISTNDASLRLDRFLSKILPNLPASLLYRYIRVGRIKVNGKKAKIDYRTKPGDEIRLYLNDELFSQKETPEEKAYLAAPFDLSILYEDENILLLNKPAGLLVHADEGEKVDTLIARVLSYLYRKGDYDPERENTFAPALCNRIDRNTSGIVIAAKNAEALRILNQKIKDREIVKKYLLICAGRFAKKSGELLDYLVKDEAKNTVSLQRTRTEGAKTALLKYKVLAEKKEFSLVEAELITGRTHQIRAQFAKLGRPLLGDGKYGDYALNRRLNLKYQMLSSYYLEFRFTSDAGILSYLDRKSFKLEEPSLLSAWESL